MLKSYFPMIDIEILALDIFDKIVAKLKNQNGSLILDGDENIFYFSHNKPPF
jgi:hypothetical protein